MRKLGLRIFSILILINPLFADEKIWNKFSIELICGFSTMNPADLNLWSDMNEKTDKFYNDDFFDYRASQNRDFLYPISSAQKKSLGITKKGGHKMETLKAETLKQEAIHAISNLPDSADIDEIMYRLYVLGKVRKGREAVLEGATISVGQLREEIGSW